jgi:ABC-2 type transport system permease protein
MSRATFEMQLRLRWRVVAAAGFYMVVFCVMVGALFPSLGDSIGKLNLPKGVAGLLGGADYSTLSGWMKSEVASLLGPLIIGGVAITAAAGATAGEEQDRITSLLLSHPVSRSRLLLAKAAAIGAAMVALGLATFAGLLGSVAVAGGGLGVGYVASESIHLAFLGMAFGSIALAIGACTGEKAQASGGAAGVAVLMFLVNGFAPVVHAVAWLRYLSLFHYYSGHDPLTNGVDLVDLAVLAVVSVALTWVGVFGLGRRDISS